MSLTPSPNDEFEARITALLLGELSATEAAVVREAIAKDPALAQLHARLQQTIGLVSEAARSAAGEAAAPAPALQLSPERREKLLRSFKVVKPSPSFWSRWQSVSMRDVSSVAAMFVVLGFIGWMLLGASLPKAKMMARYGEPEPDSLSELGDGRRRWFYAEKAVGPSPTQPQQLSALTGEKVINESVLAYQNGRSLVPSRGEPADSPVRPPVLALGREEAKFIDEPRVVAGKEFYRAPREAAAETVSAPPPPATVNYFTTPATPAPESTVALGDAARPQNSFGNRNQMLTRFTSGPEANTPAATPAKPDSGTIVLPALEGRSSELADANVSANLWAEMPPAAQPPGTVSDPQAAWRLAEPTAAGRPISGSGAAPADFGSQDARAAINPTPNFAGGYGSTTTGDRAGRGGGGGAGAARAWFGQTPAQPDNSTWEAKGMDKGAPMQTVADGLAVDFSKLPAPAAAGVPVDRFYSFTQPRKLDDLAAGVEGKESLGAQKADLYLGTKFNDAYGVVVANGTLQLPAPASFAAPLIPLPSQPQAAQAAGVAGPARVENEFLQLYDTDAAAVADSKGLSVKNPQSRGLGRGDAPLVNAPVEEFGRVSGRRTLDSAPVEKKKAEAAIEDQVERLAALQATDGGVVRGRVVRSQALDALSVQAGEKVVTEFDGDDFVGKDAKPSDRATDSRLYRSRLILLPEGERAEVLKREPQIQTGPVSTSEVELRFKKADVEELAKLPAITSKDNAVEKLVARAVGRTNTVYTTNERSGKDEAARRPSPSAPIPQPEVATTENAFSTFSLNVSDVSFKLAAAALEKGQMPDPSTVRSEEFINAFDYRDSEPAGNAPIAFAWERARYPFAHDRDLVRLSVKTAATGRQAGRPLNLVLLLDNSGSMERADRLRIRQECLRVLAGQLQPQDRVSVVAFARTSRLWVDGLPGNQAGELPQRVGTLTPEGGTNLEDAMNVAYQTAQRHFLAGGVNRVVLLTDGAANLGDVEPESLKKKVEAQRKQGIALDCFGIGWEGLNDELLEALSRNGDGRYGFVNSPEAAQDEFAGQLAGALKVAASDVKVQVEWNPRRVTAYRQIGYAKHQLKKEQFRDNTVDAAEIGAAEAGNALYTVQVNPRGEGPLGVVRVRFKVPGTSDYREHEWPLTYEGGAKPLDQSSATLRLAATVSAFSEWLVSSPFAAEVTPDKLLGLLGNVPETCGADPRPKKLEWMIRQAKSVAGK